MASRYTNDLAICLAVGEPTAGLAIGLLPVSALFKTLQRPQFYLTFLFLWLLPLQTPPKLALMR